MSSTSVEEITVTQLPVRWSRVLMFFVVCALVGVISALIWSKSVKLPAYEVRADHRAVLSERGLTAVFNIDAFFVVLGLIAGILLGILAWFMFRRQGWLLTLWGTMGAFTAAGICITLAHAITPGPLEPRLANASPGETVPVEFALGSLSAIAIWPFGVTLVLLALASIRPDPDELPKPCK